MLSYYSHMMRGLSILAKKLFVELNMFNYIQDIIVVNEKEQTSFAHVSIDKVYDTIFSFLNSDDTIEEINIDGNKQLAAQLVYDIMHTMTTEYSNRNVRILLNGEILD